MLATLSCGTAACCGAPVKAAVWLQMKSNQWERAKQGMKDETLAPKTHSCLTADSLSHLALAGFNFFASERAQTPLNLHHWCSLLLYPSPAPGHQQPQLIQLCPRHMALCPQFTAKSHLDGTSLNWCPCEFNHRTCFVCNWQE